MNKFHVLTHLDEKWPLALDFDQKVKVWLFSVQSNFDQLTEKFICQSYAFEIFWTCWMGQDNFIESLCPWLILICHWLGQTVKNYLCAVKNPKNDHFALLVIWSNFLWNYDPNLINCHIWVQNVDMDKNYKVWL